jgi:hypothetical protein
VKESPNKNKPHFQTRPCATAMLIALFLAITVDSAAGAGPSDSPVFSDSLNFWDNPAHWRKTLGPTYPGRRPRVLPLLPNSFKFWNNPIHWTTAYGPAYADILLESDNFVPCKGGPIALCYYSGPEPAICRIRDDGRFADCECYVIPYGPYYVDINSILNYEVYRKTVALCEPDGSACADMPNMAPVCEAINKGDFLPGADTISTFSFGCAPEEGIGQTECLDGPNLYAGCMTAACVETYEPGIVDCACPLFHGPFQIGNFGATCRLPSDRRAWSAAYNPNESGKTFPDPPGCIPDAPGIYGCPLLEADATLPDPNLPRDLCDEVCKEYAGCVGESGAEVGFTCDATLCTASCSDRDLVDVACNGLSACDVSAIIEVEAAVGCSCCASQICGCDPNDVTDAEIARLNERQERRAIDTQCQQNGTLCGSQIGSSPF